MATITMMSQKKSLEKGELDERTMRWTNSHFGRPMRSFICLLGLDNRYIYQQLVLQMENAKLQLETAPGGLINETLNSINTAVYVKGESEGSIIIEPNHKMHYRGT